MRAVAVGCVAGQPAVTPLALLIFRDAFQQMHSAELRPQGRSDINFGIGKLPQQEIAQPHFAAGANHQVGIRQVPRVQVLRHRVLVNVQMIQTAVARRGIHDGPKCVHQFGARAVIQRQGQHHAGIARGRIPRPSHLFLHRRRKLVLASNVFQPDVVLVEGRNFRLQIAAQQAHQEIDFAAGTLLPVLFRKRVQGQPGNPDARSGLDRRAHGCDSGAVSGHARQVAAFRPATVAVHDDGDVFREPFRIKPLVNFSFLAIQPGRNRRLQANLCCFKKLTQGAGGCNDTGMAAGVGASKAVWGRVGACPERKS